MRVTFTLATSLLMIACCSGLSAEEAIPFPAALDAAGVSQNVTTKVYGNGLLIGNGDINGVAYVAGGKLVLRLAKNDVGDWRYDSTKDPKLSKASEIRKLGLQGKWRAPGRSAGYRNPYPCPVPCGTVVVDLADKCKEGTLRSGLDLRRAVARIGTADPKGVPVSTIRALADRNVFLIESGAKANLVSHKVKHLGPMKLATIDGVQTMFQKIPAGVDWPGMSFAVALAEGEGFKAVAIVTSLGDKSKDPLADAIKKAKSALAEGKESLVKKHQADWNKFWSASGVQLADEYWTGVWYRNLYFLRTVSRPGKACIGCYAGVLSDSPPMWHGSCTLNYNCQQSFWGAFASNHLELVDPYWGLIKSFHPSARWLCRQMFESDGVYMAHVLWPFNTDASKSKQLGGGVMVYHPWAWSLGVTGWSMQNVWWMYEYAPDREFLKEIYPMLRDTGLFYANLIDACQTKANGKVKLGPSVSAEHHGWRPDLSLNYDLVMDIIYARWAMQTTIRAARILGRDAKFIQRLEKLIPMLPEYPTHGTGDNEVVVDVAGIKPHRYSLPLPAFPVFPGDEMTVFSASKTQRLLMQRSIAQNTNTGSNAFIILSIAHARMSMPDTLAYMSGQFKPRQRSNGTLKLGPGGGAYNNGHKDFALGYFTENFAATAAVSELLLQSVGNIIRVFPAWPKEKDGKFASLRTLGGFLVSAEQTDGEVRRIAIKSTVGGKLRMLSPWPAISVRRGGRAETLKADQRCIVTLDTRQGDELVFKRTR
jgi:hypothetical protein